MALPSFTNLPQPTSASKGNVSVPLTTPFGKQGDWVWRGWKIRYIYIHLNLHKGTSTTPQVGGEGNCGVIEGVRGLLNIRLYYYGVWGQQDRMIPSSVARRFLKLNPASQLVELENAGHCAYDQCPERVNHELLCWIQIQVLRTSHYVNSESR